jgi:hypothetical protein
MSAIPEIFGPIELRDYAKGRGWQLVPEAAKDRLYVLANEDFKNRQLVFPMDASAPDFLEAAMLAVEKLAALERRPTDDILKALLEFGDDSIGLSIQSRRSEDQFLPLWLASEIIEGTKQMLLASACTVLKPQAHHPRLRRTEAQQFVESARFRHTQEGSFVLNVSCPLQAVDVHSPLLPDEEDAPFVRRAVLTLCRATRQIVNAVEAGKVTELVDDIKQMSSPIVSSNLCEALVRLQDPSLKNAAQLNITWASSIPRPHNEQAVSRILIQRDYFPRIEEVRQELRSAEPFAMETFVGTVERLDGDMDDDGRRSGEVILSLLLPDGEQVRARTVLDSDQYVMADKAHMTEGTFVKIEGRLQAGRQPRQLSDLRSFGLIADAATMRQL